MFRTLFTTFLVTLLVAQHSRAAVLEDAESALNELRHATSKALTSGFLRQIKMATDLDMVAIQIKEEGMQKIAKESGKLSCYRAAADALAECVNERADDAIALMYRRSSRVADKALKTTFDFEMNIVHCGPADAECLAGVTQEIKEKTEYIEDDVEEQIDENQADVEDDVGEIKACATEVTILC